MRPSILLSSVAIALTFGAVCAQTPSPGTPLSAPERADLARMRDLHLSGPRPAYTRTLDLANRTHYRHFMAQLARAGVSAERYPQLFKSIEETRQSHVAAARRPKAAALAVAAPAAACGNDQVCAANLLTTFGAPATNPLYFQVTALSSIPNDPAVAMNIVGLYDQDGTVFAPPVQAMQHGTGYDVENTVTGSAPQTTTRVQAQGVWYYQPTSGGGVPGTFYAAVAPGQDPAIVNTSPTNVKGAQQIKVCVTRQDSDCDYFYQAIGGQQVVRFPLSGNVTYPNPIAADGNGNPLNGTASVTLSQPSPNQGGACSPLPITQNFISLSRVSNT